MAFAYAPFTGDGSPVLPPVTKLLPGQFLMSPSQHFTLTLQADNNLVIYDNTTGKAVWWATEREPPYWLYSQPADDKGGGNYLTTYYYFRFNDVTRNRSWMTINSTPLGGNVDLAAYRTYLVMQDDGNLVLNDCFPLWASNTSIEQFSLFKTDLTVKPGEALVQGQTYQSGANHFSFQADGNLVLYAANETPLWSSGTYGSGANRAVMQEDGNFVIYADSTVVWNTKTYGNPGAYLRIQANGTVSVAMDKPVWARFGFTPTISAHKKWTKWGPYDIPVWSF
jgi:hypothetical protein